MIDLEIIKKVNDNLYITLNKTAMSRFYFYSTTGYILSNFLYYSPDHPKHMGVWCDNINSWEDVSNNFQDVHNPTQNELTMFQLKYGIDLTHMLEYMKNDELCENNTDIKTI